MKGVAGGVACVMSTRSSILRRAMVLYMSSVEALKDASESSFGTLTSLVVWTPSPEISAWSLRVIDASSISSIPGKAGVCNWSGCNAVACCIPESPRPGVPNLNPAL